MALRQLVEGDIPQVVDLYWHHMRRREGAVPSELQTSFQQLYFANPWVDRNTPSFVYENLNGKVVGFLGVTARKMSAFGQPIHGFLSRLDGEWCLDPGE